MTTIFIGVAEGTEEMRAALDAALRPLLLTGVRCAVEASRRGPLSFFTCTADVPDQSTIQRWRTALATAVGTWVSRAHTERLLRHLIGLHFSYLRAPEREQVLVGTRQRLTDQPGDASHQDIVERLSAYLGGSDTLVVEGFVTFRLQHYVGHLVRTMESVAEQYLVEREHRDFLVLLRYFVTQRPQRPPVAHCVLTLAGRGFRLEDEGGAPFRLDAPRPPADRGIQVEDLVTSALMAVAPERVVLHLPARGSDGFSPEALGTLEVVFEDNVTVCPGCPRCWCHTKQDMV